MGSWVQFSAVKRDFSLVHNIHTDSETNLATYSNSFPGVKQLGHEADQAPPSSTEVKDLYLYSPYMPSCHVEGQVYNDLKSSQQSLTYVGLHSERLCFWLVFRKHPIWIPTRILIPFTEMFHSCPQCLWHNASTAPWFIQQLLPIHSAQQQQINKCKKININIYIN